MSPLGKHRVSPWPGLGVLTLERSRDVERRETRPGALKHRQPSGPLGVEPEDRGRRLAWPEARGS